MPNNKDVSAKSKNHSTAFAVSFLTLKAVSSCCRFIARCQFQVLDVSLSVSSLSVSSFVFFLLSSCKVMSYLNAILYSKTS